MNRRQFAATLFGAGAGAVAGVAMPPKKQAISPLQPQCPVCFYLFAQPYGETPAATVRLMLTPQTIECPRCKTAVADVRFAESI